MLKTVLLLSTQRSGTNFFRKTLGSHPEIDSLYGEIFDPGHAHKEQSFFAFLEREVAKAPSLCLPSNRKLVLEKYMQYLESNTNCSKLIFDIKYNSLFHFNAFLRIFAHFRAFLRFFANFCAFGRMSAHFAHFGTFLLILQHFCAFLQFFSHF